MGVSGTTGCNSPPEVPNVYHITVFQAEAVKTSCRGEALQQSQPTQMIS